MSTSMRPLGGDIEEGCINGQIGCMERNKERNFVDIDKWVSSLEIILQDVPQYMCIPAHPARISRIPHNLRELDIRSYEPCYISIGPYHHGKLSLQCMEKTKLVALKCFLKQRPELSLTDILKEISSIEPAARSFYTDVEMEKEKFVKMLLIDSLYVVIMFCGVTKSMETVNHTHTRNWSRKDNEEKRDWVNQINDAVGSMDDGDDIQMLKWADQSNDEMSRESYINGPTWTWPLLLHDLFLLENQLPFFVLQKMHHLIYGGSEAQLIAAIETIFRDLLMDYVKLDSEMISSPTEEVHHLLHLCHMSFRPSIQQNFATSRLPESDQMFRLGSAVQLYEAGVRFEEKSCTIPHSLLDISFSRSGKMSMPCLYVDDNTNSLLRNLIALEQMKYPSLGLNVSAYAVFLLHLITSPADVKLLRRMGIIQHHLASDKEMMYLINRLSVGLAFDYIEDNYSLKPVFHDLKNYSNRRVPRWRAWLKHKYFTNPWTTVSLIAASLLLIMSALQTGYQVYSYYHPYFGGHS